LQVETVASNLETAVIIVHHCGIDATLITDRQTEAEATSAPQLLSEFDRRPYRKPVSYQIVVTVAMSNRAGPKTLGVTIRWICWNFPRIVL